MIPTGEATELTAEQAAKLLVQIVMQNMRAEFRPIPMLVCAVSTQCTDSPRVSVGERT